MATASEEKRTRQRVPAAERRDALVEAAIHEFGTSGYHGTPVDRIARAVGVAQPYVFSLFGSKRELFIAAVQRCFAWASELMTEAAESFDPATVDDPEYDVLRAMGDAYVATLGNHREMLMLQLQAYAACGDAVIRRHVREEYAALVRHIESLAPDADQERIDDFFRYGMWLNVTAAMGVNDLSVDCEWIRAEPDPEPAAAD